MATTSSSRVKELDKPGDHAWLADARGKGVKIISLLLTHLPERFDYQVVFMQRDFNEILASQDKMLVVRGEEKGAADDRMRELYSEHLGRVDRFLTQRSCFSTLRLPYAGVLANPAAEAVRVERVPRRAPGRVRAWPKWRSRGCIGTEGMPGERLKALGLGSWGLGHGS